MDSRGNCIPLDLSQIGANLVLTHLPLVPHICVSESGQYWFRLWLVAYSAPSHYLKQCWVIVNWTLRNKLQWNFNQNTKLFIHEIASENIACEMAAILSSGRWVKHLITCPEVTYMSWRSNTGLVGVTAPVPVKSPWRIWVNKLVSNHNKTQQSVGHWHYTVRCHYKRGQFSHKYSQKTPHSMPVRARYGVSFVDPASD